MTPSDYETFVQDVYKLFAKIEGICTDIAVQKEFIGKRSRRKIKVDVSFSIPLMQAEHLCLVECKYYKRKVSVGRVEEFLAKLQDIGGHKGIFVTNTGFQEGAIKVADAHGIALVIIDPEKINQKSKDLIYRGAARNLQPDEQKDQPIQLQNFLDQAGILFIRNSPPPPQSRIMRELAIQEQWKKNKAIAFNSMISFVSFLSWAFVFGDQKT